MARPPLRSNAAPVVKEFSSETNQATMAAVYEEKRPEDVALFMALCPNMVQELEGAGVVEFAREQRLEDEVWRFLEARNANSHIGRRVSMCRYGAGVEASRVGEEGAAGAPMGREFFPRGRL